jgi:hypothetical protein
MSGKPASATNPRVIRVFVSSTFWDMQAERDKQVYRIFSPNAKDVHTTRDLGQGGPAIGDRLRARRGGEISAGLPGGDPDVPVLLHSERYAEGI